ncbi:uncharacterized protein LOC119739361 [Patiria miniata]|uniref:F-box domain-containing protein n=1 Tax=Patiria miniata TaxID=46514 RepID=A0A914B3X4_PATMI|nr:uncharacterized protein LOC119739361 [Patiria miniata]
MSANNKKMFRRERRGFKSKVLLTMRRRKFLGQRDQKQDDIFPFGELPNECKVKILAYLTDKEKCTAALVCTSWTDLIRTPCLWTKADFVELLYHQKSRHIPIPSPALECQVLKEKVKNFVFHLVSRQALLRELLFEFDLHEGDEIWLKLLVYLLQMTHAQELHTIQCNWTYTPHIPWFLSGAAVDAKESRVTSFHKLLMILQESSPGIQGFTMPFDWSPCSISLLCRFKSITTLELSKYWVFHGLPQRLLNRLLQELPKLRRFKLEVAVPFRDSELYPQYTMSSETLEELDIAACSGFFLWSVTLPNLKRFCDARTAWTGPILPRKALKIQCLYNVVRNGAPKLNIFNTSPLREGWRESCPSELEDVLRATCYCERHKSSPLIF